MPASVAKAATVDLLNQKFSRHLSLADHFRLACNPIARSKAKCRLNWIHGFKAKTLFFGRIVSSYALEGDAVVLGIHFVIHWTQLNCRLHPTKGHRCPVHTRRG